MLNWQNATSLYELKQLEAISSFLTHRKNLIQFLFHPEILKLNLSPEKILAQSQGLWIYGVILVK